jgi:hypothetical protein
LPTELAGGDSQFEAPGAFRFQQLFTLELDPSARKTWILGSS